MFFKLADKIMQDCLQPGNSGFLIGVFDVKSILFVIKFAKIKKSQYFTEKMKLRDCVGYST